MPHAAVSLLMSLFAVLVPQKMWYAPGQPIDVKIDAKDPVTLVLTDFAGKKLDAAAPADATPGQTVDVAKIFPAATKPGTYVLFAVPKSGGAYEGTPVVIEDRPDSHGGGTSMVTKVEPLQYAVMTTEHGPVTMMFYYDVAPLTVESFLNLSTGGYFDGLLFHRIVPDFVIQGGDPLSGDPNGAPATVGTGGPGYSLPPEFNDRKHEPGVLSMARSSDPASGGSQFFICLNYANTRALDGQYTAFGKVSDGMDAVNKIGSVPADPQTGRPAQPQKIQKIEVFDVTADHNPYPMLSPGK